MNSVKVTAITNWEFLICVKNIVAVLVSLALNYMQITYYLLFIICNIAFIRLFESN